MSSGRLTLGLVAAIAVAGCGGDGAPASVAGAAGAPTTGGKAVLGGLVWKDTPSVFTPAELPRDKILTGTIRNGAGRPVDLRVDEVDVKDEGGRSLGANVRFVGSFGHGLYGPGGPPAPLQASRYDQERLGERLTLAANEDRPITVAWRVPAGRDPAATVRVSGFTLKLP